MGILANRGRAISISPTPVAGRWDFNGGKRCHISVVNQPELREYGVLIGKVKDGLEDTPGEGKSPHYEIWVDAAGESFRIAVNVRSVDESEVLAYFDPTFTADSTNLDLSKLANGEHGFTALATGPGGKGLDYLRDNLFPVDKMAEIPLDGSGVTLSSLLDGQIERAKADNDAVIIAFGEHFHDPGPDKIFGFSPEVGVHDIHMMQGNSGSFAKDNRVNGDGALFIRYRRAKQ